MLEVITAMQVVHLEVRPYHVRLVIEAVYIVCVQVDQSVSTFFFKNTDKKLSDLILCLYQRSLGVRGHLPQSPVVRAAGAGGPRRATRCRRPKNCVAIGITHIKAGRGHKFRYLSTRSYTSDVQPTTRTTNFQLLPMLLLNATYRVSTYLNIPTTDALALRSLV